MTAISILRAIVASAANPLKTDTDPEHSRLASESVFKGQLDDAISSWMKGETRDAKQRSASDDDAREPAPRNEDRPQLPMLVTIVSAIIPAPQPASLGLPTAGLEPGSNSDGASNQTEAAANAELTAPAHGNKTAQAVAAAQPDPLADLAFALRLGTPATKDAGVEPARPTPATGQSDPVRQMTPEKYQQVEPTPVQPLAAPVEPPSKARLRPGVEIEPASAIQTARAIQPATEIQPARPTTASPPISRIVQQDGTAAESEPNPSNTGGSKKEPPAQSPIPVPPRVAEHTQPEVELKPVHKSEATPALPNSAHQEIPLQMPGPPQAAAASASIASMPAPPASVAPAPAASAPATVRNNPAPEVTDVSVTLLAPRADSTGEDRVAIRMVQKGAEIHVSVRTPDNQLSQTLRQDLGRLANGLDQAGFRTETWRPVMTGVAAPSQSSASQESSQGAPNRDSAGWDSRSGGHPGHNPGEQKRRQQDQRPRWVAELEQYKNQ